MTLPHVFRRRLGLVGASLLLCSVIVPLVLATLVLDVARPETYIAGDGVEQKVAVPEGRAMMVWLDNSTTDPVCTVEDDDGRPVDLVNVADAPTQSAGSAGDWVGRFTFEVAGGDVAHVSCQGRGKRSTGALVTPAPGALSVLSGVAVLVVVALTLAVAGLACMARADTRGRSLLA